MPSITGSFQDGLGKPIANGRIFFKLSEDATLVGTNQVAPTLVVFNLDNTGSIANASIISNDLLTPSGTAYSVAVVPFGGGLAYGPQFFILTGTSQININNAIPVTIGGSVPVFALAIVQSPSAAQTITGFPLNLGSGATLGQINGVNLVGNGVAGIIAKASATAQSANIALTSLLTNATAGTYRINVYAEVTQAATNSSTLPNVNIQYTGANSAVVITDAVTVSNTGNVVGTTNSGASSGNSSTTVQVQAGSTISYSTTNYASNGATSMQYAVTVKLEYLGS